MPQRCCREDRKSLCDQEHHFSLISFLVTRTRENYAIAIGIEYTKIDLSLTAAFISIDLISFYSTHRLCLSLEH
jgi:hypothetical protein